MLSKSSSMEATGAVSMRLPPAVAGGRSNLSTLSRRAFIERTAALVWLRVPKLVIPSFAIATSWSSALSITFVIYGRSVATSSMSNSLTIRISSLY